MRCSAKFNHDAGTENGKVTVHFHSADKHSMAIWVLDTVEADKFKIGVFYDFEANFQRSSN